MMTTARLGLTYPCSPQASKPPLVDEHAFPLTGFAVAWLGCTLQTHIIPLGEKAISLVLHTQVTHIIPREKKKYHQMIG